MLVQGNIDITTQGRKMHELTSEVDQWLENSDVTRGICQLFLQHTSASLLLCENADPDVQRDLEAFAQRLVARWRSALPTYDGRARRYACSC